MPRYDYECPAGHVHERLRHICDGSAPSPCPTCGAETTRIFAAPHVPPDGVYSYAPNIGSEESFERKRSALASGERVYRKEGS